MNLSFFRPLTFATAVLVAGGAHAATEPLAIDLIARNAGMQSVSMSADGQHLVALIGKPDATEFDTSLATWDLNDLDKGPTVTASGERMRFVSASTLKAGKVLVVGRQEWTGEIGSCGGEGNSVGSTRTFVSKVYLTDAKHAEFEEAFASSGRRAGISAATLRCFEIFGTTRLISGLPLDPERVVIAQLDPSTLRDRYLRYNLSTKESELLFTAGGRSEPGLFDPRTGDLLTRVQLEPVGGDFEQRVLIRGAESGEFEVHDALTTLVSQRYTMAVVGRDETTGKFYVLTDRFSDQVQARMYDPVAKQFDDAPLVAHPRYSIIDLTLGTRPSDFNSVVAFTVGGRVPETQWVESRLAGIHEGLKKAYPDQNVAILGYTDDRSRVLFSTDSHRHPPSYRLLVDGSRVVTLGSEREGIDPERLGEQRWVTYTARDGLKIPAILDLPAGWTPDQGPLPTVIHPHGGPWARDYGGWDGSGWVPFLTTRGYAVLRPQFRGTTGLGRALWLAGDAEWGLKMQDDKDDGAAWLVKEGIADPGRLVMFGYSYGGFAAAAAVVRPDAPYRCAIAGAPLTDLDRLGLRWSESRLQRLMQGRTVRGSFPMQHAEKARIPVLLYAGDRDVRVPAFHARDFYSAVKDRVDARFELIADMPHSLPWYPRHQQQTLKLIEDFLAGPCSA
ncbi:MAG: alpha/beta hydrolase family protein [Burkholderiales bacterium]